MAETASQTQGSQRTPRVALLWRGDPQAPAPAPEETRLRLIFAALAERGVAAEPVIYADEVANALETRLPGFDGVLVWVDPLSEGKDRARLDPLLRQLADAGVWVSAHPDVILKIGVKEILHRTRDFGWGADTDLYQTAQDLRDRFPARLAAGGPRVLKQNRGNGGQGVWKVELAALAGAPPTAQAPATVLHAKRGSAPETLALGAFMDRCAAYFANGGCIVDQAFQPRPPTDQGANPAAAGRPELRSGAAWPAHHASAGRGAVPGPAAAAGERLGSTAAEQSRYTHRRAAGALGRRLPLRPEDA
jgi:hypothetical protein